MVLTSDGQTDRRTGVLYYYRAVNRERYKNLWPFWQVSQLEGVFPTMKLQGLASPTDNWHIKFRGDRSRQLRLTVMEIWSECPSRQVNRQYYLDDQRPIWQFLAVSEQSCPTLYVVELAQPATRIQSSHAMLMRTCVIQMYHYANSKLQKPALWACNVHTMN